jgi:hypothetical protein
MLEIERISFLHQCCNPSLKLMEVLLIVTTFFHLLLDQQPQNALFNGKSLEGWKHAGLGYMVVENGRLKTEGGMGRLWYTRERVGDATLRVVFKPTGKESDSGVFIRVPERPTEPWMPVTRDYEVEIGGRTTTLAPGVLYTFTKALARPIRPLGEWNTMEVTMDGPRDDDLRFDDLVIAIDLESGNILPRTTRPKDFKIHGLVGPQPSQPEEDPLIVRREIARAARDPAHQFAVRHGQS